MNYMILIYNDPTKVPPYGTDAFNEMMAGYGILNQTMQADGVIRSGDGLEDVDKATSVRVRGGKVETMDGPFAETREHLGGYYIIDVPDLTAALRYAAMVPAAKYGTVEVRPVMNYNPSGN